MRINGDQALRAMNDLVETTRERTPEDASDPTIPVAATVVVVRDSVRGPEVLLVERPDRGSFAGAWVFPGGKVDVDDADPAHPHDEAAATRRASVREAHEEVGLTLDPSALVPLSVWDPPPGITLRIRTWFYIVALPTAASLDLVLSPDEVVAAEWLRPADVLERHARSELSLYPPTWVTLHGLRDAPSADALIDTVRAQGAARFDTVARRVESGPVMLWAEDAEYSGASDGTARHRLEIGVTPWRYTRSL